ncbi:MAG TPA: ABC transporter substrate-binding protein [Anaerolinea sp.]|nr:ABC transporter substrate-binding protein [Anaerolinea sp.]
MSKRTITRRDFIKLAGVSLGTTVLAACAPQVVTQIVKETQIVNQTQVVKETQIVSQVITATPLPTNPSPQPLIFDSSQLNQVQEIDKVNTLILNPFTGAQMQYVSETDSQQIDRLTAEKKAGKYTIGVIGALHGTFPNLLAIDVLEDLTPLATKLSDRGINKGFMELGKLGTDQQYYLPWMQATYVMAVNKKALEYLPAGVDVNALTYTQLADWGKAIAEGTNQKKVGLPAGPNGLMHRLTQGYLYPAYTGGLVTTYRSEEANTMWTDLKSIWQNCNPQSTSYNFMQDPLLTEEVWIGWDHTARLGTAFAQKPDDFIAVPAPSGPKGLYYMSVLAGLGIPKNSPNQVGAEAFIDYMTTPAIQTITAVQLGFYPILDTGIPENMPPSSKLIADAVIAQAKASNAHVSLLPIGLATRSGDFNKIMQDSFTRIVIKNEDIKAVLDDEATQMNVILNDVKAACWLPDVGTGVCQAQ